MHTEEKSKKKMSIGKQILIFIGLLIVLNILFRNCNNDKTKSATSTNEKSGQGQNVGIGQVLGTEYFDVTVNSLRIETRVRTGNEFADLKPEQGIAYLILNVTFRNTDNESRMISEGAVIINFNGKEYKFDKSEPIMSGGWGILLDQINPLTSKTTNIVYKIPSDIKGSAYYEPGRNYANKRILLGTI